MSPNPNPEQEKAQKDAEIMKIVGRREQEMADKKAAAEQKEQAESGRKALEEKAFQKDVAAERARAEAKEEWRGEQKVKRGEMAIYKQHKLDLIREEEEKRAALEKKREKEKEYMGSLHRASMIKKAGLMRKKALGDQEKAQILAKEHRVNALRNLQTREGSDRRHIEAEKKMQERNFLSMSASLPLVARQKRAEDIEIAYKRKLELLVQSVATQKSEIERAYAAELAVAEKEKNDTFLKADETQKL